MAPALDPTTRRLPVRATIDNPDGVLKPEMFANVSILTGEGDDAPAVPREAVIYEGEHARVWVARDDKTIELRADQARARPAADMVEVLEGLQPASGSSPGAACSSTAPPSAGS